jgi:hypothetical protein
MTPQDYHDELKKNIGRLFNTHFLGVCLLLDCSEPRGDGALEVKILASDGLRTLWSDRSILKFLSEDSGTGDER